MKIPTLLLALLSMAALAGAKLPDWTAFELKEDLGTYGDPKSTLELVQVDGPAAGQKAVHITGKVAEWAGLWAQAKTDLSTGKGLRFKAKSAKPGLLLVSVMDAQRLQLNTTIRVKDGGWQDFELPISLLKPSAWVDPAAPKDKAFDPKQIIGFNVAPLDLGEVDVTVGPVSLVKGEVKAKTGRAALGAGKSMVQDFELLGVNGLGSYADEKGSKLSLKLGPADKGQILTVDYDRKPAGWCGLWVRAGEDWQGQDWRGVKALSIRVKTSEPLTLDLAFNDANQCAYMARLPRTQGKGWETLRVEFNAFELNGDYQPPQAKKGAALDLSHVDAFNLAPKTVGAHQVQLDDLILEK